MQNIRIHFSSSCLSSSCQMLFLSLLLFTLPSFVIKFLFLFFFFLPFIVTLIVIFNILFSLMIYHIQFSCYLLLPSEMNFLLLYIFGVVSAKQYFLLRNLTLFCKLYNYSIKSDRFYR